MRIILSFILFVLSGQVFCQIMNDTYQLQTIESTQCSGVENDCPIKEAYSFKKMGDTIVILKRGKDLELKYEKRFVFDENKEVIYAYGNQNGIVSNSHYTYQNSRLRRNDVISDSETQRSRKSTQYIYVGEQLKEVHYIDQIKADTSIKYIVSDDLGRVTYLGKSKEGGDSVPGDYFLYEDRFNLPIRMETRNSDIDYPRINSIEYDDCGNINSIKDLSRSIYSMSFSYDSEQRVVTAVITHNPFESKATYEYNSNGDLILFMTETKRGDEIHEAVKTEFIYDEEIKIPFGYDFYQILPNMFASYTQFDAVTNFGMRSIGQTPDLKFAIKNIPSEMVSYRMSMNNGEWAKHGAHKFLFLKI